MAYNNVSGVVRLRKHLDFLNQLGKIKSTKKRAQLLEIATPEQILTICECIKNILRGQIPVKFSKTKKSSLRRYKPVFSRLVKNNRTVPLETKRELLIQRGGFLSALIAPAIGIIGSLLGKLIP